MRLRVLTAGEVRQALPMADAISGMKEAYRQLSAGKVSVPLRTRLDFPEHQGLTLFMPAYLSETGEAGIKIVSVFPENPHRALPTIHAVMIALEAATGRPVALLEGATLTAIRTGAASGAATDILARPDARRVAIIGSGVQARTQLEGVCTVRAIERVFVYSLDRQGAEVFAGELAGRAPIPAAVEIVTSAAEALRHADIICTATTSSTPVFDGHWLRPGSHVNAIGSFTPAMQEVDPETLRRSLVVVDSRPAALAEAGDLLVPIRAGVFGEEIVHAELGEIIAGTRPGRTGPEQITYFKSVGVAVQDAVAAARALSNAERAGLGRLIEL
jgi:ornithine cyclodeaminase